MHWRKFLERRSERRREAARLAALVRGPPPDVSVAGTLLPGWAFAPDPALADRAFASLRDAPLAPDPDWVRAMTAPEDALSAPPPEERDASELIHRCRLRARLGGPVPGEPGGDPLVWALDELLFLGEQIEESERADWRRAGLAAVQAAAPAPCDDEGRRPRRAPRTPLDLEGSTRQLWSEWFATGWADQGCWELLFGDEADRTCAAVLAEGTVPKDDRPRLREAMRESFYYQLVGKKGQQPGWVELALRVIEGTGDGPLVALPALLDERGWERVSRCATRRGNWAETVAALWEDRVEADARARALGSAAQRSAQSLEALVDLHVFRRLLAAWALPGSGETSASWSIVTQNRGRARGRLRAVLGIGPRIPLRDALLGLEGLHARTLAAVRQYAFAWAWTHVDEATHGERIEDPSLVTPACKPGDPPPTPYDADDVAAARTWVLLVVLRGELDALRQWTRRGSVAEKNNRFYRLLAEDLAVRLRDPDTATRGGYHRLRTWLVDALPHLLDDLVPVLAAVASVPKVPRGVRSRVWALLEPAWRGIDPPGGGYGAMIEAAHAAWSVLTEADREEEP